MAVRREKEPQPDALHLAVVVTADLAQIEADAKTHPDPAARERIAKAAARLGNIVQGEMTPELRAKLAQAAEIMRGC
jgi:hypothetical protein